MNQNLIIIKNTAENMSAEVRKALALVKNDCDNVVKFETGTYHFKREGTYRGMFYPSNNASGMKDVVFPIIGMKNVTIDGNGSKFIFCDRIYPFIIKDSENICLKNFSIDFSFLRYAWGTVATTSEDGFLLKMDRNLFNYETIDGNLLFHVGEDTLSTKDKKISAKGLVPIRGVLYIFAGESEDSPENLAAPAIFTDALETENGVYFKYRSGSERAEYQPGDVVFIGNDNSRENGLIFMEFSHNLRFNHVNIYSGAGMGFIGQMCSDILIENCHVMPNPEQNSYFSITADALHFINCAGNLTLKNCIINQTMDDAVNVHGVYTIVKELLSNISAEVILCHAEQQGLIAYMPGDMIHISDPITMQEIGTASITDVSYDQNREHVLLTFDKDITELLAAGSIIENPDRMPEILIENCDINDCPHMRISSSQKTVIRNNHLNLSEADIYVGDLFQYWYESGAITEMFIENNRFEDSVRDSNIIVDSTRCRESEHLHKKIVLLKNTFTLPREKALDINFVETFIEEDNHFEV